MDEHVHKHQEHVIASLAILTVNWDEDRDNDYLRPFVEMLAEVIYGNDEQVLTVGVLQQQYQDYFGLKLPAGVIRNLLGRLEKLKYVQRRNGHYMPDPKRLARRSFQEKRQEMLGRFDSLISSMIDYCAEKFDTKLPHSEAERYLESFLADHQSELLYALISNTQPIVPLNSTRNPSQKYMTGSFISEIARSKSKEFDYLEQVLKGMMLANVLYLPDNRRIKRRWTTAIYFDTPFLVEALGFQGDTKKELRLELLRGLRGTAAKLRCFTHNLHEVKNILYVCLNILERGKLSEAYGPMAATVDYIVEEGITPAQLYLYIVRIQDELGELGIDVYDKPEYKEEYGIDEDRLEEILLDSYSGNGSDDKRLQRKNDIDSVASIHRLRKANSYTNIEDCKAIFVTHNVALLKASHEVFGERAGEITHCITDFTLSNLLWLLSPDILPSMPRKLIIADAYAATLPDSRLWNKYIRRIEKLKNRRTIQAEDYYAYRFTQEARASLMEITRGSGEAFTDGTVQEVLNSVKRKFQEETINEATRRLAQYQRQADERTDTLAQELEYEQHERKILIDKELEISENRKARSRSWANRVFVVVRCAVVAAYILIWYSGIRSPYIAQLLGRADEAISSIVGLASLLPLIVLIAESRDGRSIWAQLKRGERRLSKLIEDWLIRLTE